MWKIAIEKRGVLGIALGAALLSAAPISLHWSPTAAPALSIDRAQARIGHPLSPGSVAGVNRRVNRRTARGAYYGGVAAAGAAVGINNGEDTGYHPYYGSGYNNLYSYAPAANAAPAANTAPAASTAPAHEASTDQALPAGSPELYAACLQRTFGACPGQ